MELKDALEKVHDRESFLVFVAALLREAGQDSGEREINTRTTAFLEAALAATADHEGRMGFFLEPSYRAFATFLYLGLIYE